MNIQCTVSSKSIFSHETDCYIIFTKQGNSLGKQFFQGSHLQDIQVLYPHIEQFLQKRAFTASASEIVAFPVHQKDHHGICVLVGLGNDNKDFSERYRRGLAQGLRTALSYNACSVAVLLPEEEGSSTDPYTLGRETAIITKMTAYKFDDFLTADKEKKKFSNLFIVVSDAEHADVMKGVVEGEIVGRAVNKARYFVDMPPSHMTPSIITNHVREIAKNHDLSCVIYNYDEIKKLGMGGLHAVARGSVEEPKFVKLEYKPTDAINKKPILLVGKGITFDSGGLSIKPAVAMETMKDDMAGAAAVIMAISVASQLKLPLHVVSLAPLTENMPSGHATKPGDVIRFYNGKTAEVKNTDAEGRLILADALSYGIKQYDPEVVIDLATLTGACAHALGPFFSGLFSEDDELVAEIMRAGNASGDYVWRLPMGNDYKKAIKSNIADICNIGDSRVKAGGSTAAHFLQHFVGDVPWVHLDIAGSAFDVPGIPYYAPGATGVGVRLLVEFFKNRVEEHRD